ncbi:MAG: type III pantothenate kinase [Acidiferrobacter sp.]
MKLLCDLGHTRVKWAWADGQVLSGWGSAPYEGEEGYAARLPVANAPSAVFAISVARDRNAAFAGFCQGRWGLTPLWHGSRREGFGVSSRYAPAESLGADRFAALVGVRVRHPGAPACVVDCGTAITVDALDARGVFRGGAILPGLTIAARALQAVAPALVAPVCEGRFGPCGGTTGEAVGAGLVLGAVGAIERIVHDQEAIVGAGALVILTGGDAPRISSYLTCPHEHWPHLTLEGLAVMAR